MLPIIASWTSATEPNPDINPTEKHNNPDYCLQYAKFVYSMWYNNTSYPGRDSYTRIDELRAYGQGKQDYTKYLPLTAAGRKDRKGWKNVDFTNILSLMPKYKRKIKGFFLNQDSRITVTAIDPASQMEREDERLKIKAKQVLGTADPGEYIPKDEIELKIYDSILGTKLSHEMAAQLALHHTDNISEVKVQLEQIVDDIFDVGCCAILDYVDDTTGKAMYKRIDIKMCGAEYSEQDKFDNSRYAFMVEFITIGDLKKKFPEKTDDELQGLARKYLGQYDNSKTFDINNSNSYYGFRIPVIKVFFRSVDTYYKDVKKTVEINPAKVKQWEVDSGKLRQENDKYLKDIETREVDLAVEMLYQVTWVIESDTVYDCGLCNWIPRQPGVRLPLHFEYTKEKSPVEMLIPACDNIQLSFLNLQNDLSRARPENSIGVFINKLKGVLDQVEGIATEHDVFKFLQETGIGLASDESGMPSHLPGGSQAQAGYPYFPIPGGIGNAINTFTQSIQVNEMLMATTLGIDQYSAIAKTPSADTPVGAMQLAMEATSDTLRPFINMYNTIRRRVAENNICRISQICIHTKLEKNPYRGVLKSEQIEALKLVGMRPQIWYGINVEMMPVALELQRLDALAQQAIAQGTMDAADWMFVSDALKGGGDIRSAFMFLAYRSQQAKDAANKNSVMQQQAITQGTIAINKEKTADDITKEKEFSKLRIIEEYAKSVFQLNNNKEMAGIEAQTSTLQQVLGEVMKTLPTGQQAQGMQGQEGQAPDMGMVQQAVMGEGQPQ